jgi:amidohydrolase
MLLRRLTTAAALTITVSITAAPAQQTERIVRKPVVPAANPKLAQYKKEAAADVDLMRELTQQMVDQVFSFGELGFQEFETSKYLTGILKKNGFTVEEGIAGIPTAWVASWGSGKPVIALGSDIDCIPQASQKPGVAYHDPIIEGAPGHGEGHNSGVPLNIVAALAVKKIMEREHLSGTLRLWPGVAEELLGSKAYFVRAGVFKDVDVALFTHVASTFSANWGDGTNSGLVSVEYDFKGESAHAAAAPWRGRSALDAVELMDVGWNFRREHLRLQQRSHYVIPNGGDQPNVVPPNASVWYYFRETDYPHIKELWDIGDQMAKGATLMTNTSVSSRVLGSAWPAHLNKTVSEATYENIKQVARQRIATGAESARARPRQTTAAAERARQHSGRGKARRRLRRHRRRVVDRPDGHASLSGEHTGRAGAQLGRRDLDGDAYRAQGRHGRRQSAGDDGARSRHASRARQRGMGLFQQRADQDHEIRAADAPRRQAGHLAQRADDGEVPTGDEEVLLRPDEVQDIPRAAGDRVSDGASGGAELGTGAIGPDSGEPGRRGALPAFPSTS